MMGPVGVPTVNRIAYINSDGALFTIDPDGSNGVQLTGAVQAGERPSDGPLAQQLNQNELYAWPTWSPDGSKLAVSRVLLREEGADMALQVVDVHTAMFTTVYRNQGTSLVAAGVPHYIYWAPDNRTLSFLAVAGGSVTLFLWDAVVGGEPIAVESNTPLYYHWASDSGAMVMHSGSELKLRYSPPSGSQIPMVADARRFRVPAFSPDASRVAYVRDIASGGGLFVAPINDLDAAQQIMEVGAMAAFLWAPDGSTIAVADQGRPGTTLFDRLHLVPAAGGEPRELANERFMSFFWSPSGEKIAWTAVDAQHGQIEWAVTSISSGEQRRFLRFRPTREVLTMLSFFDQYAYSYSPWSPDGTALVVAGTREDLTDHRNGSGPAAPGIYVLDAEGGGEPRQIAAGSLTFWSWN